MIPRPSVWFHILVIPHPFVSFHILLHDSTCTIFLLTSAPLWQPPPPLFETIYYFLELQNIQLKNCFQQVFLIRTMCYGSSYFWIPWLELYIPAPSPLHGEYYTTAIVMVKQPCQVPISPLGGCVAHFYPYPRPIINWFALFGKESRNVCLDLLG